MAARKVRKHKMTTEDEGPGHFKSKFGLVVSCLGCVVGTGNIWRFPRIVANNSDGKGCLQFLLAWLMFLLLWSIPIIIIEYGVGRYTRKSTIRSFRILVGPWWSWCGAWMTMINTIVGCYYSVVLGWCFYFLFRSIFYPLPSTHKESEEVWDHLQDSSWPIFCHFVSIFLTSLSLAKAASSIEFVNKIIIPFLLTILAFSFYWSLTLKYASYGINFLFTPDWDKLKEPRMWVDAASQNVWDTGAGLGLFVVYANYMTRENSVVKMGILLPAANNLVSFICCLTTFSTVFSVEMEKVPAKSQDEIVQLLQNNGKANTGLTFIWMPILYRSLGPVGPYLCSLFFFCLSLGGLSSLISLQEIGVHTLEDFKVRRKYAIPITAAVLFCGGLPSAIDLNYLINQDFVWSFASITAGAMMLSIPIRYGASRFRQVIVNDFGYDDWKLTIVWQVIIKYIAPLEALVLFVWWSYDTINSADDDRWYQFGRETFMMAIVQIFSVILVLILINVAWMHWRPSRQRIYTFGPSYGATDQTVHEGNDPRGSGTSEVNQDGATSGHIESS